MRQHFVCLGSIPDPLEMLGGLLAYVASTREEDKPPPSCVEVVCTLEDMYVGCRKYVRFNRKLFEGTKLC